MPDTAYECRALRWVQHGIANATGIIPRQNGDGRYSWELGMLKDSKMSRKDGADQELEEAIVGIGNAKG